MLHPLVGRVVPTERGLLPKDDLLVDIPPEFRLSKPHPIIVVAISGEVIIVVIIVLGRPFVAGDGSSCLLPTTWRGRIRTSQDQRCKRWDERVKLRLEDILRKVNTRVNNVKSCNSWRGRCVGGMSNMHTDRRKLKEGNVRARTFPEA